MQPQSPNPNFDFMLKDQPKTRRVLPMPNLPKWLKITVGVVLVLLLIIVIASILSGRKNKDFAPFVGVAQRAQETIRVTALAQQAGLQDAQTQALATTVSSALASDKQQILKYLADNKIKASTAQLNADQDKSTDTSLQTAAQNNSLDTAYVNYLKTALTQYETDLQNANKTAGPNGQKVLASTFQSTRTILNSAPVKS